MSVGKFEVDTDFLKQNTNSLAENVQTLKKIRANLENKLAELSNMWEGPAKDAFHAQFAADCEAFRDLCEQLQVAIDCLGNAAQEYENCDRKVRGVIDAIKIAR